MQFLIEQDDPGQWRWRLIGRKNETLLRSDDTFPSRGEAANAATTCARTIEGASRRMSATPQPPRRIPRPGPRRPIFAQH
ncbi:hypothetical protein [Methylobacterium sp. JK268]